MDRVETLKEQAAILRRLAESFDVPALKNDLLKLAQRCEEMAAEVATQLSGPGRPLGKPGSD
jgi:hypothetical protein